MRLWVKKHSHDDTTGGSHEPRVASHDSEEALVQALPTNEDLLAFEKTVELFDVVYLGTLVNKDGSGYPANSVIIGMFEGYYSNPKVGGVPCAPSIGHSLDNLLPPQSLLEVQRSDVRVCVCLCVCVCVCVCLTRTFLVAVGLRFLPATSLKKVSAFHTHHVTSCESYDVYLS